MSTSSTMLPIISFDDRSRSRISRFWRCDRPKSAWDGALASFTPSVNSMNRSRGESATGTCPKEFSSAMKSERFERLLRLIVAPPP